MSRFWHVIMWSAGIVLIAAGTLLLMGSLRQSSGQTAELEQARLEALASQWEGRLVSTRMFFRDQVVRNGILDILEQPEGWSVPRLTTKFGSVQDTWSNDDGILRGLAAVSAEDAAFFAAGDTSGLSDAVLKGKSASASDIVLLDAQGTRPGMAVLNYQPVAPDPTIRLATMFALIETASLFSLGENSPSNWVLMSTPTEAILKSPAASSSISVSRATWPLLVSRKAGTLKQSGSTLCFACVHVPGMEPLVLVESVHTSAAAAIVFPVLLILLGLAGFSILMLRRRVPAAEDARDLPPEDSSGADPTGYRHIFHVIEDPVCVVDLNGRIIRANRSAQEWLKLVKGHPTAAFVVKMAYGELSIAELLNWAMEDPATATGECNIIADGEMTKGTLTATRLSRDESGRGPVLIHFHRPSAEDELPAAPSSLPSVSHDSHCPFPVLSVTAGGVITSFNQAARQTCPKIEDTPMLGDVLTGLDSREIPGLLAAGQGTVFESLFGSNAHEFQVVIAEGQILLFGHKLSASKKLEVELKQVQESFNTLCALSPAPVLLADPHDHIIIEANHSSAMLFGVNPADLRGRTLDSLTAAPWDFAMEESFFAASANGAATPCLFRYELIKIEGMPALLVVLETMPDAMPVDTPEENLSEDYPDEADSTAGERASVAVSVAAPLPVPLGPGLLVSLNPTVREVARRLLEKSGHPCEAFTSLDDATVWLITHDMKPEFVAVDLSDFDDAETWVEDVRKRCGTVPCLAFTDGANYTLPGGGLNKLLAKPFDLKSLLNSLNALNLEAAVTE